MDMKARIEEALRLNHATLVQDIEQALARSNHSLTLDVDVLDADWEKKYDTLRDKYEATRSNFETVLSENERLRAELCQSRPAKPSRGDAARRKEAEQDKSTGDSGDIGSEEAPAESVTELRQSLEKARLRYAAVKGHLDTVVALARTRKEQIIGWVKYADSLELKIQKLEKKRSRRPTAGSGTLLPLADHDVSASGTRGTEPNMPPTPVTVEKPRPLQVHTEVEKPTLSASFSSSSSSFLGIIAASDNGDVADGADDAFPRAGHTGGSDDKDIELPDLPLQTTRAVDDNGQSNEATIESTQGDPSSEGSLPDLPTPRAAISAAANERQARLKEEPSSDSPEVVWERPAKRSRVDERSGTPRMPAVSQTVKRERDLTEDAARVNAVHYRESQESIDLDEGQLTVPTPRKRQLYLERMASGRETDRRSASDSQSQERPAGPPVSADPSPTPTARQLLPPAPEPPVLQAPQPSAPLAPVSANIRRGAKDPVTIMTSLKRGIESLAEDNEDYCSTPDRTPKRPVVRPPPGTGRASRLKSLLNARPAEPSPVTPASGRRSPSRFQSHRAFDSPLPSTLGLPPPPRVLPHMRGSRGPSPTTPGAAIAGSVGSAGSASRPREPRDGGATPTVNSLTAALAAAKADSAARKPAPPLRGTPMEQLTMDDFKINPATNNGATYAYNEVVRGRSDRANLAGCTDPQCCGKVFRGMAASELDAAGQAHVDRAEGIALMERHLGDEAFKLSAMGPGEKRELWVEARTRELADKYGKHRHRHHRRASPPGFWDTDFPTTQEEEYNRAEAEKVERITVQERYREAMRPGGRWLFRDE